MGRMVLIGLSLMTKGKIFVTILFSSTWLDSLANYLRVQDHFETDTNYILHGKYEMLFWRTKRVNLLNAFIYKNIELRFGDCKQTNFDIDANCYHDYDYQYCCKDVVRMSNKDMDVYISRQPHISTYKLIFTMSKLILDLSFLITNSF